MSVPLSSPRGRGILLASIVGSGMAFLDGTVVNVALPALARGLGADLAGLQWTLDAYLLTLCAFLLTGGSLGDRLGRKPMFELGVVGFAGASLLCGLAPSVLALALARGLQGLAAALLVPVSLSLVRADIDEKDQGTALGLWTGLSGVTSAVGPLVGGWLVEAVSWRAIFFLNLPLAAVALWAARRCLPAETRSREERSLDLPGAAAGALAVGGLTYALIEGPAHGWGPGPLASAGLGAVAFVAFLALERRPEAMMPLALFRLPVFSATNGVTLLLYSAMGCAIFLLMLELQIGVGLSPVAGRADAASGHRADAAALAGHRAVGKGARWSLADGAGRGGRGGWLRVLPPAPSGRGMDRGRAGGGAPGPRAVARGGAAHRGGARLGQSRALGHRLGGEQRRALGVAGLLGVAAVPWAAGLSGLGQRMNPAELTEGFHRATLLCAGLCVAASVASVILGPVPRKERGPAVAHPGPASRAP